METDEQLSVLMAGLRGSNIRDEDFAAENLDMRLIEVDPEEGDGLPLTYEPLIIERFWRRRPVSVVKRGIQLLSTWWKRVGLQIALR